MIIGSFFSIYLIQIRLAMEINTLLINEDDGLFF